MKLKKFLLISLCAMMLFAAACGTADQDEGFNIDWSSDMSGGVDLGGYEAVVLQSNTNVETIFSYVENTTFSDLVLQKIAQVEDKLHCKVTLTKPQSYNASNLFMSIIASINVGDIFFGEVHNFKYSNLFEPLTGLEDIIDYTNTEKWGNVSIMESLLINGEPYGVTPTYWPYMEPSVCYVMLSNDRLVREFGMTDPREHYESNTWTWDTFINYVENCTDLNRGIFSVALQPSNLIKIAILSNGVSYLTEDSNGNIVGNLYTDATLEAIQWAQDFYNNYSDKLHTTWPTFYGSWEAISEPFINKEAVFNMTNTAMTINYVSYQMDEPFAILPFPRGPKAADGYWGGILEGNNAAGILLNSKDVIANAYIIDELFTPLEGYETKEDRMSYYLTQLVFNRQDAEILFGIDGNALYSYWPVGADGDFWNKLNSSLLSLTPIEMLDRYYPVFETIIDEYIRPNYDYVKEQKSK